MFIYWNFGSLFYLIRNISAACSRYLCDRYLCDRGCFQLITMANLVNRLLQWINKYKHTFKTKNLLIFQLFINFINN